MPTSKRQNFFDGRLLAAGDLTRDQTYRRGGRRPRLTPGTATGLAISVSAGDVVKISAGVAVTRNGRLIEPIRLVAKPVRKKRPKQKKKTGR